MRSRIPRVLWSYAFDRARFAEPRAARIAVNEVQKYRGDIEAIFFVCFDSETADIYRELVTS